MKEIEPQITICKQVSYKGKALHSGKEVQIVLKPAGEDTGILFKRVDLEGEPVVRVSTEAVINSASEVVLGHDKAIVRMPEHLLAAIAACGIDNLFIEVDNAELPIADGGARAFMDLLEDAGLVTQNKQKKIFRVDEPVWVEDSDGYIVCLPSDDFYISCIVDFPNVNISGQFYSCTITKQTFYEEIAPARTFGFWENIKEALDRDDLRGGSLDVAVVIRKDGIMNENLKFKDELVRHKILDLVGDFSLLSCNIKAKVLAAKISHSLNLACIRQLQQNAVSYQPPPNEIHKTPPQLDIHKIQNILPHRYPFLLVDKIISLDFDKGAVGIKNVSMNEPYFLGHFPQRPIMPGVLILEAMAQVGGVYLLSKPENQGKLVYFTGIDKVRFRKVVVPGDQLLLEVVPKRLRARMGFMEAQATVDGKLVAQATFMYSIVD